MPQPIKFKVVPLSEVPLHDLITTPGRCEETRVLVVDDEPLVADTLSAILKRAGMVASAAYNGASALEIAGEILPALLITDVSMPQMNGVELAIALVSEQPFCKVILFSGHATSADLVSAAEAGYDFPLLTKPMHPTELLRHITTILQTGDELASA